MSSKFPSINGILTEYTSSRLVISSWNFNNKDVFPISFGPYNIKWQGIPILVELYIFLSSFNSFSRPVKYEGKIPVRFLKGLFFMFITSDNTFHKKHKKNLCFLCFSRILKFTYNKCYSNNFLNHKIKSINFHKSIR